MRQRIFNLIPSCIYTLKIIEFFRTKHFNDVIVHLKSVGATRSVRNESAVFRIGIVANSCITVSDVSREFIVSFSNSYRLLMIGKNLYSHVYFDSYIRRMFEHNNFRNCRFDWKKSYKVTWFFF